MLSKNQIKLIKQLNQKKYRKKHRLFFAEGIKTVKELLASDFRVKALYTTGDFLFTDEEKTQLISERELKKISSLKTPQLVLGVFHIPEVALNKSAEMSLVLDGIRDPGNLGTIIRLCDWFGIKQLVCSQDTVDCYNPKTIQATMGSLTRVNIIYTDLITYLEENRQPVFGTFMDGEIIYDQHLPKNSVIVMGNEANGISPEIEQLISYKVTIPQFGKQNLTESLNVATATGIVLNEFLRWEG